MNFKKSKDEIGRLINQEIQHAMYDRLSNLSGQPLNQMGYAITDAVAYGVQRAVLVLMENTYTDQEFEEDMTLRDK